MADVSVWQSLRVSGATKITESPGTEHLKFVGSGLTLVLKGVEEGGDERRPNPTQRLPAGLQQQGLAAGFKPCSALL